MKELIVKKDDNQITLIDKDDIQDRIDDAIASNNTGWVNLLITYDNDTTETLHLKGYTTWDNGGSSGGGSSSGDSADSSSDD